MQALLLMNETQFLEASRALAERSIKEGGNDAMGYLFKLVACRPMRDEENRILSAAHTEYLATYTKDVAGAKKLISVGETKPDAKLDAPKVAAMMMIANTVLNLDEVLTK